MGRNVSLKDIAKKVGVSIATVSYVLSKGKDSGVSEAVSERVKQAAEELGYQPNRVAQSLKMGKTFSIGLIVADISNPFFAEIARKIEDEAKKNNYTVVFGSSDEKTEKARDLMRFLANRQVDGFIIVPTEGAEEQIKYLKKRNIPFVLIDRYYPGLEANHVVVDNHRASYKAVRHMLDNGVKKIAMIGYSSTLLHMRERIRGYREAMEEEGVPVTIHEVDYNNTEAEVKRAIDDSFQGEQPMEGVLFATNSIAIPGLREIDRLGLIVSKDIAVVSFDYGVAFDFYYCPLTYVKQPLEEISKMATEILITEISEKKFLNKHVCLDAELVVQSSGTVDFET